MESLTERCKVNADGEAPAEVYIVYIEVMQVRVIIYCFERAFRPPKKLVTRSRCPTEICVSRTRRSERSPGPSACRKGSQQPTVPWRIERTWRIEMGTWRIERTL